MFNKSENKEVSSNDLISLDKIYKEDEVEPVTGEYIQKISPRRISKDVAEECASIINASLDSEGSLVMKGTMRDNIINMMDVLKEGKFKFTDYVNAVKFSVHKMSGMTNVKSYALVFPDRVQRLMKEGATSDALASYASIYSRQKLVTSILAKMMIPTHIMYHDIFDLAVQTQVALMTDPKVSPKVRGDCANSLMSHLKPVESKNNVLPLGSNDEGVIGDLAKALANLSAGQREMLSNGRTTLGDISDATIIEVEKNED